MRKLKAIGLHEEEALDTGWEGFGFLMQRLDFEKQLVEWEEKHPRAIMGFDVWDPRQGPLSREEMGWPARRACYVSSGAECARSKRHTLEELDKEIQRITEAWLQRKDDEMPELKAWETGNAAELRSLPLSLPEIRHQVKVC